MRSFEECQRAPGHRWVLATVMTGAFMGGLDTYIVNVSLPTIAGIFGAEIAVVQWVPLAYLVTVTSTLVSRAAPRTCGAAGACMWGGC